MLGGAGGRPIAFPLVSYSSSSENGSSSARQAEFVRRLRDFLGKADGRALLFARYVELRDEAGEEPGLPKDAPAAERRRRAFLANRGASGARRQAQTGVAGVGPDSRTVKR